MFRLAPILALALGGCLSVGVIPMPPEDMRGDIEVRVLFTSDVVGECLTGARKAAARVHLIETGGCWYPDDELLVLKNPCQWPRWDGYARLACHEIGHPQGFEHFGQ